MIQADLPIVSPRDSASYNKLIEYAQNATVDTDLLRDILWLIVAHNQLIALPRAASRLISIIEHAPESWQPALNDTGLNRWRPILDWVISERQQLTRKIGEHFGRDVNTAGNNPVMGSGATSFPIYACLCESLPAGFHGDAYLLLVGQLVLAHVAAMREESSRTDYEHNGLGLNWYFLANRANSAALAVRRLAEPLHQSNLDHLPLTLAPEEFAETLEELPPHPNEKINEDRINLSRFLQKCWGIVDWVDRAGGGGGSTDGGHKWVGGRREVGARLTIETYPAGDEDDPQSAWGKVEIAKTRPTSLRKQKARLQSDLPPDEDEDDEDIVLSDYDCGTTKLDIGALARAARAKARHVAKANQLVPWAYLGLAVEEVARLLAAVSNKLKAIPGKEECTSAHLQEIEILLLIHIMLWTGSGAERAAGIRLCEEHHLDSKTELGIVVSTTGQIDKLRWRIKALAPDYKTVLDGTAEQLRTRATSFDLPDLIGVLPFIRRQMERHQKLKHNTAVFDTPPKVLEKRLKTWLNQYSPDGRITITKLAGTLWNQIYLHTGDPSLASCVTGEMHTLARVRLFYTTPSATLLRELYLSAVHHLAKQTYEVLAKPFYSPPPWKAIEDGDEAVGARLCPTVSAVRHLFKQLREDIASAIDYVDRPGFIRYHNLLTLFVVQFFAYATTCRAIVTPYLFLRDIHPSRNLASISDKDDASRHKTRLIWIPDALKAAMVSYEDHIQTVKAQLAVRTNKFLVEPCFFLDETFQPELVRPKSIEPRLAGYLNVRANTHRRFLRTELIERGCPPEVVDAYMGHWQQGEEPFGIYSSFSFAEYVAILQTYLDQLLAEISLDHPIKSRWN